MNCEILLADKQLIQAYIIDDESINNPEIRFLEVIVNDENVFINKDVISFIYHNEY